MVGNERKNGDIIERCTAINEAAEIIEEKFQSCAKWSDDQWCDFCESMEALIVIYGRRRVSGWSAGLIRDQIAKHMECVKRQQRIYREKCRGNKA